jgi:hypothetical protein
MFKYEECTKMIKRFHNLVIYGNTCTIQFTLKVMYREFSTDFSSLRKGLLDCVLCSDTLLCYVTEQQMLNLEYCINGWIFW